MDYKNDLQSDDDFDSSNGFGDSFGSGAGHGQSGNTHGLSKAELRKTNKPIMEKRRRARINHCLNELKSLILEAMKKDPARHTKLEKADILEMTVKHLQSVQRQQLNMAIQTDPTVIHKFKTGFIECAEEVNRYISQLDGVDTMVRQRLTNHLNNCATNLEQLGSMSNFNNGYRGQIGMGMGVGVGVGMTGGSGTLFGTTLNANTPSTLFPPLPQDLNNNTNAVVGAALAGQPQLPPVQMGGVQLIPSRLPSGEIALIVPSAAHNNLLQTTTSHNNNSGSNGAITNHNNNLDNSVFTSWQHSITAAANAAAISPAAAVTSMTNALQSHSALPLSDFTTHHQRLSAFSKPPTASVPPSSAIIKPTTILSSAQNLTNHINNNVDNQPAPTQPLRPIATTNIAVTTQQQQQQQQHLHHSSTATNSPPLSPISSMSSHGDDSLMHTSSDFNGSRPATPPQEPFAPRPHSFSGVFSTPSSAETSLASSTSNSLTSAASSSATSLSAHLQQQQVSSTSGNCHSSNASSSASSSANSSINDAGNSSILNVSLKRSREHEADVDVNVDDEADSSDAVEAPAQKKIATASTKAATARSLPEDQSVLAKKKYKLQDMKEERDSMWRPW